MKESARKSALPVVRDPKKRLMIRNGEQPFEGMIGRDEKILGVFDYITAVAHDEGTVLIQGESGTGKELVARAIHNLSHRREQPFVVVNCAAVPQGLIERELFGHNRGAFTGAINTVPGKLELAQGGTVFLDDIDTADTTTQAKLLRVIQHKEFERLGGNRTIRVDIRFVAASNKDLPALIQEGGFRADLFFRLNVFSISLPPLRHRREDIPLLVKHFLRRYGEKNRCIPPRFSGRAVNRLVRHEWPGNIRELENLILQACAVTRKTVINHRDLPFLHEIPVEVGSFKPLRQALEEFERAYIGSALERFSGSRRKTSQALEIHRNTLLAKILRLGL